MGRCLLCVCLLLAQVPPSESAAFGAPEALNRPLTLATASPLPNAPYALHHQLQIKFENKAPGQAAGPVRPDLKPSAPAAPGGRGTLGAGGAEPAAGAASKDNPEVKAQAPPSKEDSCLKSLANIANAFWNMIKLAVFGIISIISSLIEGIVDAGAALCDGRVADFFAAPFMIGLNAAWNTIVLGALMPVTFADSFWQWIKPESPRIDVTLAGSGPRLRTSISGGPLFGIKSAASVTDAIYEGVDVSETEEEKSNQQHQAVIQESGYRAYTITSAFMYFQTPAQAENLDLQAHEFGHTRQLQNSFLIDQLIGRLGSEESANKVEKEADQIGKQSRPKMWIFQP